MKFLDKIRNLLVILNLLKMESGVRSILNDAGYVSYVLRLEGPVPIKALSIYQECCTSICNVLPWIKFQFDTLHVSESLFQRIIIIGEKCGHVGDKDLRFCCCQRQQCQSLLMNSI